MVDRLLVDVAADGRATLSSWFHGGSPAPVPGAPPAPVWPMGADEAEDLRWYLEDYLGSPFGVYEQRGEDIARDRLPDWGRRMFSALFASPAARGAYDALRRRSGRPEIVVRSAQAAWLGLPWELLADPGMGSPVTLEDVAVSRGLPGAPVGGLGALDGGRLRVLMVISRPRGVDDVGYRMVARPLLRRLADVRGDVDLVVLRPPTFDALAEVLETARRDGEPFQVVHFDGHGDVTGGPGADVRGRLVFEGPVGGAHFVSAEDVARVLGAAGVPVVVLNACQSGALGKVLETAVATSLLAEGAASVVAMAYRVYAVAAAEFIAAFYDRLVAGGRVAEAVTAGRVRLAAYDGRPSIRGPMPLADWVVPVHYLGRDVHFPALRPSTGGEGALPPETVGGDGEEGDELASHGGFVGRDGPFYLLEVAARRERVIVVHGTGGTGKTELAKAFGRWWRDTGGVDRPELVVWHTAEPGLVSLGLEGVLSAIGLRVLGVEFAGLDLPERRAAVASLMARERLLVVLDNMESAYSMPDPNAVAPPLGEADRAELAAFLAEVRTASQSTVLVTSRTPEAWLGPACRIELSGLDPEEAAEYADALLVPVPDAAPRRAQREFAELMDWLDGHPLSMRLTLPWLATTDADVLLSGLRGLAPLPGDGGGEGDDGRTESLSACVTYSFVQLPPEVRRRLVMLSLVHGTAHPETLGRVGGVPGVPDRFAGVDVDGWGRILEAATAVGLLRRIGGSYGIHPALPHYLAGCWRAEDPEGYGTEREAAETALLRTYASFSVFLRQQLQRGERLAVVLVDREHHTLRRLLGLALERGAWAEAQAILRATLEFWELRGLNDETRGWAERIRTRLEAPRGCPPDLPSQAGELWLLAVGTDARRLLRVGRTVEAESGYQEICDVLLTQPPAPWRDDILATAYHELGRAATERAAYVEAEDLLQRALALREQLGLRAQVAATHHHLGVVAQARGDRDEAHDRFLRSLAISEDLGDRSLTKPTYYHLGMLAHSRGRLDEAQDWYLRMLPLVEEVGDLRGLAITYRQLGALARDRSVLTEGQSGDLALAELGRGAARDPAALAEAHEWYRRSLTISEQLGDRRGMATSYHQLGTVAQYRGALEEARGWLERSRAANEEFEDKAALALDYYMLGSVSLHGGDRDHARDCYRRSFTISEEIGARGCAAPAAHQLGIVAQLRGMAGEQEALAEAVGWYQRALALNTESGDRAGMVNNVHQLGAIAQLRGEGEEALRWYRRSAALREEMGDRQGTEAAVFLAGTVSHALGRLDEARECYLHALAIDEERDDHVGVVVKCDLLATVAEAQERPHEELRWILYALVALDIPAVDPDNVVATRLATLTTRLGLDAVHCCWRELTGDDPPPAVLSLCVHDPTRSEP